MLEIALVVLSGLWTGAIATIAWERIPIWRRLGPVARAVDFRRTLYRMDPTMPIVAVVLLVLGVIHAFQHDGTTSTLTWLALACVALIVIGSLLWLEPINTKFRRLPEGTLPPDSAALHIRWVRLHLARTGIAIASLALFAAATLS